MYERYSTEAFESSYTYSGNDLGASWSAQSTAFRLWAPTAQAVSLLLYHTGDDSGAAPLREIPMQADIQGTWSLLVPGNLNGMYYTYRVLVDSQQHEICDPYARTAGINGHRAMVLDLSSTNPSGWETDCNPHAGEPITDAVIYEVHMRDLSMHPGIPFRHRGKFLALTESGLKTKHGHSAGIDHICALGITHVQLMPVFDFSSVDESSPSYNWGYDPANYNLPEGSYATDPRDGATRVREFKQMVKYLHDRHLSVVMDVVFNHVYDRTGFCINQAVPGYFSRVSPKGVYSNGSGCGNDTASERSMVRKYILDSLKYWAQEYHIDGFRFDLAGLLDAETIQQAISTLKTIRPDLLFYGEGWDMPTEPTKPDVAMATQLNAALLPQFSFFNDTLRDLIRGSTFEPTTPGYVSGYPTPRVCLNAVFMGMPPWAQQPEQCINYVSCHDNHTLFDRIAIASPDSSFSDRARMSRLAAAFTILSQGVPFLLAGEELLRSKPGTRGRYIGNSYRSSDRINAIRWSDLDQQEYADTVEYYRGLIAFRKAHPALRLSRREEVARRVRPLAQAGSPEPAVFSVDDTATELLILFHPGKEPAVLSLPEGIWEVCIQGSRAGTSPLAQVSGEYTIEPISTTVLVRRKQVEVVAALIWEKDKFLICQRPPHKARGLLWEFVGGKVEPGESFPDALVRECREELGITVQVGQQFTQVIHDYPDILIRLTLFHCMIAQGSPQLLEHSDLRWIHPRQIDDYAFCPADTDILAKLKETYGSKEPL